MLHLSHLSFHFLNLACSFSPLYSGYLASCSNVGIRVFTSIGHDVCCIIHIICTEVKLERTSGRNKTEDGQVIFITDHYSYLQTLLSSTVTPQKILHISFPGHLDVKNFTLNPVCTLPSEYTPSCVGM